MNFREKLLMSKIKECVSSTPKLNKLVNDKIASVDKFHILYEKMNAFILSNDLVFENNNFVKYVQESFLNLANDRFSVFLKNVINGHKNANTTYEHMINDIKDNLNNTFNIPESYYSMNRVQLDKICDKLLLENNLFLLKGVREYMKETFTVATCSDYIFENVAQARRILRLLGYDYTDNAYIRITALLKNNPGYIGLFTYFNKVEKIPFVRLSGLYMRLMENQDILNNLPDSVINYMNPKYEMSEFMAPDGRVYTSYFEKLEDDLNVIEDIRLAKKYSEEYPGRLRRGIHNKSDFVMCVKELDKNAEKLDMYNRFWIKKVSRYKTQQELIDSLLSFVIGEANIDALRNTIKNDWGLRLVYDDGDIIVVRVLSQESLKQIASDTSWCIKDYLSYWQDYVGEYNIQLVIINNLLSYVDVMRKIGLTLTQYGSYSTAHRLNDSYISREELEKYLITNTSMDINDMYNASKNLGNNEYYSVYDVQDDNYRDDGEE